VILESPEVDWKKVWACKVEPGDAAVFLKPLKNGISFHEEGKFDHDIAHVADLVARIANGTLVEENAELQEQAQQALEVATERCSSIGSLLIVIDGPSATSSAWSTRP